MVLLESMVLGLGGGVLGMLLAWPMLKLLLRLIPVELPFWMRFETDGAALLFTFLVALLTGLLFGIVPAWQMSGHGSSQALREGARGASGGRASHRIRSGLVMAETALALVLLVGAGLMMQSFLRLLSLDAGIRTDGLLAVYVSRFVTNASPEQLVAPYTDTYDRVLARLGELPGVTHVGGSYAIPYKEQPEQRPKQSFAVQGQDEREQRQNAALTSSVVSPSYFETMGIPLLAGRTFTPADMPSSEPVVIVNRRMAETLWPGREAIGQMVLSGKETLDNRWARVVGVVDNTTWYPGEAPGFEVYYSHRQWPIPALHLLVRVQGDPAAFAALARRTVHEVEPDLAINDVQPMRVVVAESLWQRRLWGVLFGAFALSALALGAVGIYGVMSQAVGQRTRELGIRVALGARRGQVLGLVLREGMTLAVAGTAAGLLGALALSRLLSGVLYGISATDPLTLAAMSALLVLVALGACLLPARRATRVDPAVCLRVD
jgi:putative ABC transport system permease protein